MTGNNSNDISDTWYKLGAVSAGAFIAFGLLQPFGITNSIMIGFATLFAVHTITTAARHTPQQ